MADYATLAMTNAHKRACRHLRRQALCVCGRIPQTYWTQRVLLLLDQQMRAQETTSAMTRPTPAPVRPTARAAPVERSSTRPRMKGPRSLTVTTTLRPPWVTLSLVPNGSERWAQVMAFWLKRAPEAVLLPDSLP